jgi:hypothetical protein
VPLPRVAPAPLVTAPAGVCPDLVEHRGQCRHCQNSRTGRRGLPTKSRATLGRWVVARAAKPPRSRCFSAAPWGQAQRDDRRLRALGREPNAGRLAKAQAARVVAAPVGAQVGSRFGDVDRPCQPGAAPSPRAPTPVTRHAGRGPVRFPGERRRAGRAEEGPPGGAGGPEQVPARARPPPHKERRRRPKGGDPVVVPGPRGCGSAPAVAAPKPPGA